MSEVSVVDLLNTQTDIPKLVEILTYIKESAMSPSKKSNFLQNPKMDLYILACAIKFKWDENNFLLALSVYNEFGESFAKRPYIALKEIFDLVLQKINVNPEIVYRFIKLTSSIPSNIACWMNANAISFFMYTITNETPAYAGKALELIILFYPVQSSMRYIGKIFDVSRVLVDRYDQLNGYPDYVRALLNFTSMAISANFYFHEPTNEYVNMISRVCFRILVEYETNEEIIELDIKTMCLLYKHTKDIRFFNITDVVNRLKSFLDKFQNTPKIIYGLMCLFLCMYDPSTTANEGVSFILRLAMTFPKPSLSIYIISMKIIDASIQFIQRNNNTMFTKQAVEDTVDRLLLEARPLFPPNGQVDWIESVNETYQQMEIQAYHIKVRLAGVERPPKMCEMCRRSDAIMYNKVCGHKVLCEPCETIVSHRSCGNCPICSKKSIYGCVKMYLEKTCCICSDAPSTIYFNNCFHMCVCQPCLVNIRSHACPLCNVPIRNTDFLLNVFE